MTFLPRRWLRRLTRTLTTALCATTAGAVLVTGAPVTPVAQTATTTVQARVRTASAARSVPVVAARRWPGHPGRRLLVHRVHRGDTATGLAVRFHAWTAELVALNHLGRHGALFVGERITIPVVVAAARRHQHVPRHHRTHHRVHQVHRIRQHHPWRHADASRAEARRQIVRTARRCGVNPRLALAVAWQESGWQQRRRSSAGAIGAMQVMPGTGRWMSIYAGRRLHLYDLHDNVLAGVLLLRVLRSQTTWRRTVAGYYQGLGSVRHPGPYPSTRRYTRQVLATYRRLGRGWRPA